jgi:hypothetical protein
MAFFTLTNGGMMAVYDLGLHPTTQEMVPSADK